MGEGDKFKLDPGIAVLTLGLAVCVTVLALFNKVTIPPLPQDLWSVGQGTLFGSVIGYLLPGPMITKRYAQQLIARGASVRPPPNP